MKTLAPELSALIIILGSAGPVISTRRSSKSARCRGNGPVRLADVPGRDEEIEPAAGVEVGLAVVAALMSRSSRTARTPLQVGEERQRLVGQDAVGARDTDRAGARCRAVASSSAFAAADGRLDEAVRLARRR